MAAAKATTEEQTVYQRLAAPFDKTFSIQKGGQSFTYISKEQVYTRANEVLGVQGWGYEVIDSRVDTEADEIVVRVRVTVNDPGAGPTTYREGFGSSKVKRSRSTGAPFDLGNDYKAALSDAVKTALSGYGIGLYLYEKDGPAVSDDSDDGPAPAARQQRSAPAQSSGGSLVCADCGEGLKDTRFRNGDTWSASDLAKSGRSKYGRALCMDHYREAKAGAPASAPRQAAPAAADDLPF